VTTGAVLKREVLRWSGRQFWVERDGHESLYEAPFVLSEANMNDKQLIRCTYLKRG
jgi:hypothetical protein